MTVQRPGFDVVGMARVDGVRNAYEETAARTHAIGRQADRPDTDSVFLSGTGKSTLSIIQALEDGPGQARGLRRLRDDMGRVPESPASARDGLAMGGCSPGRVSGPGVDVRRHMSFHGARTSWLCPGRAAAAIGLTLRRGMDSTCG